MRDFPIELRTGVNLSEVEAQVEQCCSGLGLMRAMKDTLGKYPGCIHWHYKKKGVSGTLEVTLWPSKRQLWLTVQEGRRAEWIEEELPKVKRCLTSR
jgi:hypothetical protein